MIKVYSNCIPDICHFFYTSKIFEERNLHRKITKNGARDKNEVYSTGLKDRDSSIFPAISSILTNSVVFHSSAVMNPVLYVFSGREFRQNIMIVVRRVLTPENFNYSFSNSEVHRNNWASKTGITNACTITPNRRFNFISSSSP